ncbi:phage tail spike protein [Carnobacterium sp. ISL-102]|uniref:phage tail spike protein n=1 Tax=Carnobacterium sp. ISL-102 TaxID=2819142 RepID=UPI001BE7F44B|nr:phage tail spike protein [Carnobacterium sp. ISL-102]MBT2732124.1 phage tail protein [Carnobacterium sp. ISL-102]
MTPILYKANETDFYHRGIGSLGELTFVEVTEEGNGDFGLVLEYPTNGRYFNSIEEFMFIKAKPNSEDEAHIFRIYEIEKDTIGMSATIYATSKTITDLQGNMVRKVIGNNEIPQQILNRMKSNLIYPTTYDFYSDITTKSSTEWIRRNPLNCISGEEGSLLQYWGGEIKRGNQVISLLKRRGKDNVATIRYGKNLNGLVANFSVKGMVTRILPHFTYTPEGAKDPVTIEGSFVDSQYINNYPIPFIREVDYSSDEEVTDLTTLNAKAKQYFTENIDIDKPSVTMDIQIEDLFSTSEYSDKFKQLEKILLFDTVTVYHKVFDILITAKVNKLVFDSYREKNVSLEVGSIRNTLMDDVKKDTQYQLNEVKKELNYLSISADGKNRINYGSATPLIASINDLWFKPNGEFTIMYRFDGAYWQKISDSEDLDKVAKEVEQHTDEIAAVTQSANDAVTKADQAIADAGFIKLDVAQVKSDALTTASTAQSAYNNAISALNKADTAISTTESFSLLVNDLEQSVTFKADSSRVDTISSKVDSQSLLIQANADALIYKADKTLVDTINQTVNQHTNDISINAQAINARLTSTQVDSLVAAKNYVNQTQLNTTSSGLQLDITKVSTDLSNLEIGGRNYFKNSEKEVTGSREFINSHNWDMASIIDKNGLISYVISFDLKTAVAGNINVYAQNGSGSRHGIGSHVIYATTEYKRYSITFIPTNSNLSLTQSLLAFYGQAYGNGRIPSVKNVKMEIGNKTTDWSPAPEDMATLEQFTTLNATVDGIQTTVGTKANQTQVTQLANQITTKVESSTYTTKMTQLDSSINLKVAKADLISQINIQSNNILIQSGKLYLDAASVIFSGSAFIPSAAITSLTVDKLNGGTANFANFNAININVSSLVGNTTDFIQSNWNKANTSLSVNAAGLTSVSGALSTTLNAGSITTVSGTKTGTINALGMQIANSSNGWTTKLYSDGLEFQWYGVIRGITQTSEGLEIKPTTGSGARLNSALALTTGPGNDKIAYLQLANPDGGTNSRLEMNGTQLSLRHPNGGSLDIADYAYNGQLGRINSGKFRTTTTDGRGIQMEVSQISVLAGNQTIYIMPSGTGELRIGNGSANPTLWPIRASQFIQGSSRDSKTNINDYTGNALNELSQLKVVTYNRKDDLARGVDYLSLGFIAEDSPAIAVYNAGMPAGVDQYKMVSLAIKGIQELDQKVISIGNSVNANNTLASRAFSEMQQLKNKVTELELKIQKMESAA